MCLTNRDRVVKLSLRDTGYSIAYLQIHSFRHVKGSENLTENKTV